VSTNQETEPQVERTTIAKANRRQLGFFQYSTAKKVVTGKRAFLGSIFCAIAVTLLTIQGSPESGSSQGKNQTFSFLIPSLGDTSPAISPPSDGSYNRAEEAKGLEQKSKNESKGGSAVIHYPGPKLIARPRNIQIPPGTFVRAVLISGASNGLVKSALLDPIQVGGETLVEAGTIAIGQGNSTEDRLYVRFTKLVSRDGTSVDSIQAEAADVSDKITGLKGSKISSHALSLAAGIGLNFAAGFSEGLQDKHGEQGVVIMKPTLENALLHATAQASLEESKDLMNKAKNEKEPIAVESGKEIYLLFSDNGK